MMNKGDHLAMSKKFLKYSSESFIKLHFFFIISAPCLSMNSKLVNCNLSLYFLTKNCSQEGPKQVRKVRRTLTSNFEHLELFFPAQRSN